MSGDAVFRVILWMTMLLRIVGNIRVFIIHNFDIDRVLTPPSDEIHQTTNIYDLYRHLIEHYTEQQNINDEFDPHYDVIKEHDQLVFQIEGYFLSDGDFIKLKQKLPRDKLIPQRSY